MTKDEALMAFRCLDEIERALPPTPPAILGRAAASALRKILANSHGAAAHAPVRRTRKRGPRISVIEEVPHEGES